VVLAQIAECYPSGNFPQLSLKAPVEFWMAFSGARELERAYLEVEVPPVTLPVNRSVKRSVKRNVFALPVYRHEVSALAA